MRNVQPKVLRKAAISPAFLANQLRNLRVGRLPITDLTTEGADSESITEAISHRPGLALAGFTAEFTHQRIQILGNTECAYLQHLSDKASEAAFKQLLTHQVPCIFITDGNELAPALVALAQTHHIPLYATPIPTARFTNIIHDFLADQFAEQTTVHGSLVDVYGTGLLLTGKSGIGKSEVALDLIERGHRLVADDVVVLTKKEETVLMGAGTDLVQHFMEIRGLGLLDIRAMFGIRAIRFQKRVEVVVNLQEWDANQEYTRLGMIDETITYLNVALPLVKLPIIPGKNMTVICEVIAMNHLLRYHGYDAAQVFEQRLQARIAQKKQTLQRGIEYFGHDYE